MDSARTRAVTPTDRSATTAFVTQLLSVAFAYGRASVAFTCFTLLHINATSSEGILARLPIFQVVPVFQDGQANFGGKSDGPKHCN